MAELARQTPASPTTAHLNSQHFRKRSLWKVFKFFNHNLAWLLHRIFVARTDEKDQSDFRLPRPRYASELMFRNDLRSGIRRSSAKGLERHMSRFPVQDMRQGA